MFQLIQSEFHSTPLIIIFITALQTEVHSFRKRYGALNDAQLKQVLTMYTPGRSEQIISTRVLATLNHSSDSTSLMLDKVHSCTHSSVLILHSFCCIILHSFCIHSAFILHSFCTHSALILLQPSFFCIHSALNLNSFCSKNSFFCTHSAFTPDSFSCHSVLLLIILVPLSAHVFFIDTTRL